MLVCMLIPASRPILCSDCFEDHGLHLDAQRIGIVNALRCPKCGARQSMKLPRFLVEQLAFRFFVRGSVLRSSYGSAPFIQFNTQHFGKGDYAGSPWLKKDVQLISETARIGLFHYGPRLWMLGRVEPLEGLQDTERRASVIARILKEYKVRTWRKGDILYRLRSNPQNPSSSAEYDSPPIHLLGEGRLESPELPVLYCSQDIEGCAHECRVTAEDELYLATLTPHRDLRLLDLTEVLVEERVTEFESLDMAVHMLFYAGKHSYPLSREIALAAKQVGFDGILYSSYFERVRSGAMPFETVYGISVRRFPSAKDYVKSGTYPNIALFGRPVSEGLVEVVCINRVIIRRVSYDLTFGPVRDN